MADRTSYTLTPVILGAAMLVAIFHAPATQAAPQVVAALPTGGEVVLACREGTCAAEISTICLQRDRATPNRGERYRVHGLDAGALRVTGTRADGSPIALDAKDLAFTALRGQIAFRVAVPEAVLVEKNLAAVAVSVTAATMLTPVPDARDPYPLTAADIERAEKTLAAVGGGWQARNADAVATARVAGRIINRLPAQGVVAKAKAEALIETALAGEKAISPESLAWTKSFVDSCREADTGLGEGSMRRCLTRFHDRTLQDLNKHYWRAARPQS